MPTYCERQMTPKHRLDPRSFRWAKAHGKAKVLVACPRGKWNAQTERCKVGMRAYKVLAPARGRCPTGQKRVAKT